MNDESRLDRLERRLAALEEEIGQLRRAMLIRLGGLTPEEAARQSRTSARARGPRQEPDLGGEGPGRAAGEAPERTEAGGVGAVPPAAAEELRAESPPPQPEASGAARAPAAELVPPAAGPDVEQWLGQRGLLVIGLLALVVAAAFLLQYAFERGWISPLFRILSGLAVGGVLWWQGERLVDRGMRHFGAALVGGGGAVAYLALWAAAGPHRIVPPWSGIVLLGLLAMVVLMRAARLDEHVLAALAGAGAYLAPLLLPDSAAAANLLVVYAVFVAFGTGTVAALRGWRAAFGVSALGAYLLLGVYALDTAHPWLLGLAFAGGGALAAMAARVRGWPGLRAFVVVASWTLLVAAGVRAQGTSAAWGLYLWLPILALPSWRLELRSASRRSGVPARPAARGEAPAWPWLVAGGAGWALAARAAAPEGLALYPALVLAPPALAYLAGGVGRRNVVAYAVGMAIAAWAVAGELTGLGATGVLALLGLASGLLTRPRALAGARWVGPALEVLAALRLLSLDLYARRAGAGGWAALGGPWAWTLYLILACLVLLGGPLAGSAPPEIRAPGRVGWPRFLRGAGRAPEGFRSAVWAVALLLGLAGGTTEVLRLFPPAGGLLARELAVSVFWLFYAGGLLAWGFWRDRRPVRIAGLAVSGLALLKVVFYDLTALDALYRVGSFFLLALIALATAFAYHRRTAREDGDRDGSGGA